MALKPPAPGTASAPSAYPLRSEVVLRANSPINVKDYAGVDPTGVTVSDTGCQNALNAATGGGHVVFNSPGTYLITPSASGLTVPNDVTVEVEPGATILAKPNTATGAGTYILFSGTSSPPTRVRFIVNGTIDGNRRNGNHGLSETIFAAALTDGQHCSVTGWGKFVNFRGDGVYFGHSTTIPKGCRVVGPRFEDIGVKESGDSGNPRMGVTFIAGTDCLVDYCQFDTIGSYAIDFEGNGAGDNFDGVVAGPNNTFRGPMQGQVNLTTPGTISPSCRVYPALISGTAVTGTAYPIPANRARFVQKRRTAGDVVLNGSAWVDVNTALDIVLPGQVDDFIEVALNGMWSNEAQWAQLDVATIVSGSPVHYFGSNGGAAPADGGISAWRGINGQYQPVGGRALLTLVAGDLSSGTVTLRLRGSTNSATNRTLLASASQPLLFAARNLGPGW